MAHNLDMTGGRANVAFTGSRNDIWHRMGQEMLPGQSLEDWAAAAGLGWTAIKVPADVAKLPDGANGDVGSVCTRGIAVHK